MSHNLKWKWDFTNENFDELVAAHILSASEEQKLKLPTELAYKVWKGKKKAATGELTFLQKIFFLYKVTGKRIFVVFEDEERGLTLEKFVQYKEGFKTRKPSISEAEDLHMDLGFCFGAKELMDSLDYFNMLSAGPAYKYVLSARNASTRTNKVAAFRDALSNIMRMLTFYEGNKRRIAMDLGISVPELYLLMHLYTGEKKGSSAYNIIFKYAYNSSKFQMIKALARLADLGYIEKFGGFKFATYRLTPAGSELIHKIIKKYILDY